MDEINGAYQVTKYGMIFITASFSGLSTTWEIKVGADDVLENGVLRVNSGVDVGRG